MISCRFLDKNEVQRFLPLLFSILHGNMSVIAPTGNAYDEDYALWSGAVDTAMQKENRQIVLIFNEDTLIGYLQYLTNETTFMIEEAQVRPAHQGSGVTHEDCEEILKEMPYMRDGQEFLRSYLYPHDTDSWRGYTMEAVEEEISLLCHGISHLFYVPDENNKPDELIHGVQTEIDLLKLFYDDGNYGRAWRNIIFSYGYLGYLYAKTGDYEKGIQYLKQEIDLAKQFDALDRITILHSRFFEGREFDKHTLGSTFVASSRVKTLLEEKYPLPDEFKATPEYQEIIKTL